MINENFNWRIPKTWNEIPTSELEALTPLTLDYNLGLANGDRLAEPEYKLKALLMLCGFENSCSTEYADGTDWYTFRVAGKKTLWQRLKKWVGRTFYSMKRDPYNEYVRVPMEVIAYLTKEHMAWINDPYTRLKAPYPTLTIGDKEYRGPSDKMTSVTYQQYQTAQNLVTRYWQIQESLRYLLENNGSEEAIIQQGKGLDQVRQMFLACMFSPGQIVKEITKGGQKIEVHRETFEYDPAQLEHYKEFAPVCDRVFPLMLQFYFSVQQYYSTIFPDLFVKREDDDTKQQRPDFMLQEVETMTAIMKYQGFADYQTIYDSNTVHILKVLDNMAHEAKEMKKITAKH